MKIFISYSDNDRKKMIALEKAIKESALNLKPIVVAKDAQPGVPLSEKIKKAINNCDIIIPIITEESIKNQWVNQEIGFAVAKEKKIFPIVDNAIIKNLKGFIHDQIDIPFNFKSYINDSTKETRNFKKKHYGFNPIHFRRLWL